MKNKDKKDKKTKKISIARYISVRFIGVVGLMSLLMAIFVTYFSNAAIEYDIKNLIHKESKYDYSSISYVDGKVVVSDNFVYEENGVTKVVLDADGAIISGRYPDANLVQTEIANKMTQEVRCPSGTYYVFDRMVIKKVKNDKNDVVAVIRSVANRKNLSSEYAIFKYASFICVGIILLVVLIVTFITTKQVTEPMKQFCDTAENIGNEKDLSKRIEYDGMFKEIDIMTKANNRMLDQLEEMFKNQRQFSSDVAHELRTPVSVMKAECEFAMKHGENEEDYKEALTTIERQVKKTNQIIMQLLQLSRMDQDRLKVNFERADIREIVEYVCENERIKDTRNITITEDLQSAEADIDVSLITVVVRNLVNNAVKYSPPDSKVEVSLRATDQRVFFRVRDYGVGMSEEEQKHIFDRFYRADKSRNSEGYGLGLSIVEKIMEIHHGEITVESRTGEGSVFHVILPRSQNADNKQKEHIEGRMRRRKKPALTTSREK